MCLARKRRSWQMLLPHIGLLPAGTKRFRKSRTRRSACASSTVEALTRSTSPLLPCVPLFHASIASSTASLWCTASTGPSTRRVSCASVTTTATSMMRSVAGFSPVISRSIHTRWLSSRGSVSSLVAGMGLFRLGRPADSRPTYTCCRMAPADTITLAFTAALLLSLATKFWLATRQMRHVAAHRDRVPAAFAGHVSLSAHQRAADYTLAKGRFGLIVTAFGTAVLVGWTLIGGLDALNRVLLDAVRPRFGDMAYQLALLAAFVLISALLDLPFEAWSTFRIEQRFGFNRVTPGLFVADLLKSRSEEH